MDKPGDILADKGIIELYERFADSFNAQRSRALFEQSWLDSFLELIPAGETVLDLGCGMGEPIAQYILSKGKLIVGIDSSPSMIELCRSRFPQSEWIIGDMRELELGRQFAGILAWDSFFHLTRDDQRSMFPKFAKHIRPGGGLLFTSGPDESESIGQFCDTPLYHSSLSPAEYRSRLSDAGFTVMRHISNDTNCGGHTVWLSKSI